MNLQSQSNNYQFGVRIAPNVSILDEDSDLYVSNSSEIGLGIGIDYYYKYSSHIKLRSGLLFSSFNLSLTDYTPLFGCDLINNDVDLFNSWLERTQRIYFLEIPVEAQLNLRGNINVLYAKFGVTSQLNIFVTNNAELIECRLIPREIEFLHSLRDISNFNFGLEFGLGYSLQLSEHKSIFFEPSVNFGVNEILIESQSNIEDSLILYELNVGFVFCKLTFLKTVYNLNI